MTLLFSLHANRPQTAFQQERGLDPSLAVVFPLPPFLSLLLIFQNRLEGGGKERRKRFPYLNQCCPRTGSVNMGSWASPYGWWIEPHKCVFHGPEG